MEANLPSEYDLRLLKKRCTFFSFNYDTVFTVIYRTRIAQLTVIRMRRSFIAGIATAQSNCRSGHLRGHSNTESALVSRSQMVRYRPFFSITLCICELLDVADCTYPYVFASLSG